MNICPLLTQENLIHSTISNKGIIPAISNYPITLSCLEHLKKNCHLAEHKMHILSPHKLALFFNVGMSDVFFLYWLAEAAMNHQKKREASMLPDHVRKFLYDVRKSSVQYTDYHNLYPDRYIESTVKEKENILKLMCMQLILESTLTRNDAMKPSDILTKLRDIPFVSGELSEGMDNFVKKQCHSLFSDFHFLTSGELLGMFQELFFSDSIR